MIGRGTMPVVSGAILREVKRKAPQEVLGRRREGDAWERVGERCSFPRQTLPPFRFTYASMSPLPSPFYLNGYAQAVSFLFNGVPTRLSPRSRLQPRGSSRAVCDRCSGR